MKLRNHPELMERLFINKSIGTKYGPWKALERLQKSAKRFSEQDAVETDGWSISNDSTNTGNALVNSFKQ